VPIRKLNMEPSAGKYNEETPRTPDLANCRGNTREYLPLADGNASLNAGICL
jgi:hypothetical protein